MPEPVQRSVVQVRPREPKLAERLRALVHRALRRRATAGDIAAVRAEAIDLAAAWDRALGLMLRRTRVSTGNAVEVFEDGDALFESLWGAIDAAQRQVLFEMYILEPDAVGGRTIAALRAAAERGCEVVLLYDAVGSSSLGAEALRGLIDAGAVVAVFNPPFGPPSGLPFGPRFGRRGRWGMLQRNHRKLAVIDGAVAYTGGMNVSDDYAGPRHGNARFVDTHLRIEGPVVPMLSETLRRTLADGTTPSGDAPRLIDALKWTAREAAEARPSTGAPAPASATAAADAAHGIAVQVLESQGRSGRREIQREMRLAIETARSTFDIATPYLVPPRRIVDALAAACRRGVRVRLLTAGQCDVPLAGFAARHVYARLLRRGVRIYELQEGVLHAKTAVADGVYAMVGSFNLDQWSHKRNLELNVGLVGEPSVDALHRGFEARIARSRRVDLHEHLRRAWWRQLLEWGAYLLMKL